MTKGIRLCQPEPQPQERLQTCWSFILATALLTGQNTRILLLKATTICFQSEVSGAAGPPMFTVGNLLIAGRSSSSCTTSSAPAAAAAAACQDEVQYCSPWRHSSTIRLRRLPGWEIAHSPPENRCVVQHQDRLRWGTGHNSASQSISSVLPGSGLQHAEVNEIGASLLRKLYNNLSSSKNILKEDTFTCSSKNDRQKSCFLLKPESLHGAEGEGLTCCLELGQCSWAWAREIKVTRISGINHFG